MRLEPEGVWSAEAVTVVRLVGDLARAAGLRAYLVGGPVRDLLLGRPTLDLDIAVEGEVGGLAEALSSALDGQAVVHQRFGTAVVDWSSGLHVDLATTRRESYPEPGALPKVAPAPLDEDLRRRDFTVHAMALPLTSHPATLIDPLGGRLDLQLRLLRSLHPRTFADDPTRIMRAARYAATFDFTVEPQTLAWLRTAVTDGMLRRVSGARLWGELERTLVIPEFARACELLAEWDALAEMGLRALDRLPMLPELESVPQAKPAERALAALGMLAGEHVGEVARAFELSLAQRDAVQAAAAMVSSPPAAVFPAEAKSSTLHEVLRRVPRAGILALWASHPGTRGNLRRWLAASPWQADVTGDDLMASGYPPGPGFREALEAALRAKLDDGADRQGQLQAALQALEQSRRRQT